MSGKQYTVRGISDELDATLREEAERYGKSFNAYLIHKLSVACGITEKPWTNGLEKYIGTWVEDPGFDEAMEECSRVHPDQWAELEHSQNEKRSA